MMIRIIPFEAEHAVMIELRKADIADLVVNNNYDLKSRLNLGRISQAGGPAFTILYDDIIIASAGVIIMNQEQGLLWAMTSVHIEKYPLAFVKNCKKIIKIIVEDFSIKLLYSIVLAKNIKSLKWNDYLGFNHKILIKDFIGHEDYYLYIRGV